MLSSAASLWTKSCARRAIAFGSTSVTTSFTSEKVRRYWLKGNTYDNVVRPLTKPNGLPNRGNTCTAIQGDAIERGKRIREGIQIDASCEGIREGMQIDASCVGADERS